MYKCVRAWVCTNNNIVYVYILSFTSQKHLDIYPIKLKQTAESNEMYSCVDYFEFICK